MAIKDTYKEELKRLMAKHGYYVYRNEDGDHTRNNRKVKPSVRRHMAKLEKYYDRALFGYNFNPLWYWAEYSARGHSYTTKQMSRFWSTVK